VDRLTETINQGLSQINNSITLLLQTHANEGGSAKEKASGEGSRYGDPPPVAEPSQMDTPLAPSMLFSQPNEDEQGGVGGLSRQIMVDGDQDEGQITEGAYVVSNEGVVVDLLENVARVVNVSSVRTAFRRWLGAARQATALRQELRRARKRWWSLAFRQWRNVVDNSTVTQAERRADRKKAARLEQDTAALRKDMTDLRGEVQEMGDHIVDQKAETRRTDTPLAPTMLSSQQNEGEHEEVGGLGRQFEVGYERMMRWRMRPLRVVRCRVYRQTFKHGAGYVNIIYFVHYIKKRVGFLAGLTLTTIKLQRSR
jgi:hypothetical protein